jgi:general secretion pathway protein A
MDGRTALILFVLLCAAAAALLYRQPLTRALDGLFASPAPVATAPKGAEAGEPAPPPAAAAAPRAPAQASAPIPAAVGLTERLARMDARTSRLDALAAAIEPWEAAIEGKPYLEAVEDDPTFFNLAAKIAGFQVQRVEADIEVLRRLNMPAVLELRSGPKAGPAYLALVAAEADRLLLKGAAAEPAVAATPAELQQAFSGVAYLPWKNFLSLTGTIPGNAPADSVLALKMLLRDLGYAAVPMTKDYDPVTQKAVEQIQARYGLPIDGVVGNLTKIIIYREGKGFNVPPIARPQG